MQIMRLETAVSIKTVFFLACPCRLQLSLLLLTQFFPNITSNYTLVTHQNSLKSDVRPTDFLLKNTFHQTAGDTCTIGGCTKLPVAYFIALYVVVDWAYRHTHTTKNAIIHVNIVDNSSRVCCSSGRQPRQTVVSCELTMEMRTVLKWERNETANPGMRERAVLVLDGRWRH